MFLHYFSYFESEIVDLVLDNFRSVFVNGFFDGFLGDAASVGQVVHRRNLVAGQEVPLADLALDLLDELFVQRSLGFGMDMNRFHESIGIDGVERVVCIAACKQ